MREVGRRTEPGIPLPRPLSRRARGATTPARDQALARTTPSPLGEGWGEGNRRRTRLGIPLPRPLS
ncbi:hypothetical protein ppKF707_5733 [Metapseudomonas furukawaii]|uniref:Uncharacterized protein n=1 Tax=Metapseudomonas furukawaii TaxID=1149133 RepID=A0AAD1BX47_METFU|nr:hypothetical protein ppKF707_5733 [Pseudomonas furukawaii]BAU72797.1 hypothetical protein KF707C_11090 [Pseudomonas furukawaii]